MNTINKGSAVKELVYRYSLGEQSWTLDWFEITMDEWISVEKVTGWTYPELCEKHDLGSMLAMKAMMWLARRKAGETITFDSPEMTFPTREFRRDIVRDIEPDTKDGKGGKPGPTRAPKAAPRNRSKSN